jgi:CIC family chloride channel protein
MPIPGHGGCIRRYTRKGMSSSEDAATESATSTPNTNVDGAWGWGLRFGMGVLIVAVGAAVFAVGFRTLLGGFIRLLGGTHDVVSAARHSPRWLRAVMPALGGLVAGLLGLATARSQMGQGVGDVMEAVVLGRVRLSMRVTLLKSLASLSAIATGGSLGREGPLIQFGGAIGSFVGSRLGLTSHRIRLLIAAGTAAGFAAAYNTPFAAILFVLEVVTGVVALDAILPSLLATAIAVALVRWTAGEGPIYGQRAFRMESTWELVAYAGLGLGATLVTLGFTKLMAFGERCFRRRTVPLPWRPAVGGALTGAMLMFLPEIAGNGYEPLNVLLGGGYAVGFVVLLLAGKIVATTASVSSGSPGGVFTPTLLIGGASGFLYAHGLSAMGLTIGSAGGYALVGMAAATAAAIHAPLLASVMIFELSGDYAIVLPLVLATALATLLSRRIQRDSIYTAELARKGVGWEVTLDGRRVVGTGQK